nr:hypothetical protein A6C57_14420 [Fibrella sp. ES10-3-2-2]
MSIKKPDWQESGKRIRDKNKQACTVSDETGARKWIDLFRCWVDGRVIFLFLRPYKFLRTAI